MKILVIGAGSVGKRHAENAKALGADVKIFDADAGKSDFAKLEDALAWKPRACVIAAPHKFHIALARKCVEAGADVLIEKPISHEEKGVAKFLAGAKAAGRQVFVACNMRFHPGVRALKENLNKAGEIYFARAQYGNYLPNMRPDADYRKLYCAHKDQGGGVIFDVIHEIDYLAWMLGPVTHVTCEAETRGDLDIDVEDYAAMILRHESGARSEIHMDYLQQFKRRGCEIAGRDGTLTWESSGKNPEACAAQFYGAKGASSLFEAGAVDVNEAYRILMRKFMNAVEKPGSEPDLLTGERAFEALKVAVSAHLSAARGRRIGVRKFRETA